MVVCFWLHLDVHARFSKRFAPCKQRFLTGVCWCRQCFLHVTLFYGIRGALKTSFVKKVCDSFFLMHLLCGCVTHVSAHVAHALDATLHMGLVWQGILAELLAEPGLMSVLGSFASVALYRNHVKNAPHMTGRISQRTRTG